MDMASMLFLEVGGDHKALEAEVKDFWSLGHISLLHILFGLFVV